MDLFCNIKVSLEFQRIDFWVFSCFDKLKFYKRCYKKFATKTQVLNEKVKIF